MSALNASPALFLEYADELCDWIGRLNHPRFGANLDIGHSQVLGENLSDAIYQLGAQSGISTSRISPGESTII